MRMGASPRTPGILSGMTRVFKDFCWVKFVSFGETEAGAAGTQPAKG